MRVLHACEWVEERSSRFTLKLVGSLHNKNGVSPPPRLERGRGLCGFGEKIERMQRSRVRVVRRAGMPCGIYTEEYKLLVDYVHLDKERGMSYAIGWFGRCRERVWGRGGRPVVARAGNREKRGIGL